MVKKYISGESKAERKFRKQNEKKNIQPVQEVVSVPSVEVKNTKIAFVLGNGISRKSISCNNISKHGTIYGCNALYREFEPDYLVAVDTKMIQEITSAGYHNNHSVWTNPNRYTRTLPNINLFNPNLGWSSGPSALNLASIHGYETIYILGFDYEGVGNNKELVNNIYAGTHNYKNIDDRATYFGNWTRQTATAIQKFPNISYVRVIESVNSFVPDVLVGLPNLKHITIENFKIKYDF